MFVVMSLASQHTAILLFSYRPTYEGRCKRWWRGRSNSNNQRLAQKLYQNTQWVAASSQLPVFHFHEGNQRGNNFGQRLTNAYAKLFAQGFEAVIAIGNDCPELFHVNWQEVKASLAQGQCVLGETQRGGAYLIGLPRAHFCADDLQQLPWQQKTLFQSLQQYCRSYDKPLLLPVLQDLNDLQDLVEVVRPSNEFILSWRVWLLNLLYTRLTHHINEDLAYTSQWHTSPIFDRGPPQMV